MQEKLRTLKKNNSGRGGHMQSTGALPRVDDAAPLVPSPPESGGKPPVVASRFSDAKARNRAEPLSMMSTLDNHPRSDVSSALRSPEVLSLRNESTAFETLSRTSALTIGSKISPGSTYNTRKLKLGGGYATSGSGEDQTKYLQQSELTPLINPDFEWKLCLEDIRSSDWSKQFEACNTLRRVCAHHAELITSSHVRTLSSSLQVQSDSLRSSLAKNAMITLKELFAKLKKAMDADIETLTPTLMKRSADTNVFIAAEGRNCMQQMVLSCSEGKVLLSLLPYASSKNASVKSEAAVCFGHLIMRLKSKLSSFKGNDKLMISAATLLGDASQEVRNNARAAFRELFNAYSGK